MYLTPSEEGLTQILSSGFSTSRAQGGRGPFRTSGSYSDEDLGVVLYNRVPLRVLLSWGVVLFLGETKIKKGDPNLEDDPFRSRQECLGRWGPLR